MKAVEWLAKLQESGVDQKTVLEEFGKETADLVAARTANSNSNTKFFAAQGAIREQKQKFTSFSQKIGLAANVFDKIIDAAIPDFRKMEEDSKKVVKKEDDDVANYRKRR